MAYRKDIDGLRAVAVLAVVLFHAKVPGFSGGFVGVDVFFVISGYLITGLIAQDWTADRFSFATFYFRRIRRIVPALLCVYVACTLAAALLMLPSDISEFGRSLLSSATFVSNHFFYRLADYFGGQSDLKPLLHTWSLSIEEQFYLVWPPLFLVVARWRYAWLRNVVWAVAAISLAASAIMVIRHREAAFFLAPFRAWELLLGAALALTSKRTAIPARVTEIGAAAGLAMIAASVALLNEGDSFPGLLAVPPCLGAALLIIAGMERQPVVTRLLSTPPAVAVGLISYSLYLWHWPILSFARYHVDRPLHWTELAVLLPASLLAAFATYRYVEQPARRLSLARAPHVIGAGVLSLGAIALAGHQIDKGRVWTLNLNPEIRRLDMTFRSENVYRRKCSGPAQAFGNDEGCTFGRPRAAGSYDMAIFGDSHADAYTPAMSMLAQRAGLSGRQITAGGCVALLGYYEILSPFATEKSCRLLREAMVRFVDENPRLRLVALAHRWSIYTGTSLYGQEGHLPFYLLGSKQDERSEQRSRAVLNQALKQTLDYFESKGIQVVLLGEMPPLGRDPIKCIAKAIVRKQAVDQCGRPLQEVRLRLDYVNGLMSDLAEQRKGVSFFSPVGVMCEHEWCGPILKGVVAYRDNNHLNRMGAEQLSQSMSLSEWPSGH